MRTLWRATVALVALLACFSPVQAQDIPAEAREELERRGMTVEEAMERARQLGIDLSNPTQAARRARELGIPASTIEYWMGLASEQETPATMGLDEARGSADTDAPTVIGLPVINPTTVTLSDKLLSVTARVGVRDRISGVASIRLLLARAPDSADASRDTLALGGDTLRADQVTRVQGDNRYGTWEGLFSLPPQTRSGSWELLVSAADSAGNVRMNPTASFMRILSPDSRDEAAEAAELSYFGYEVFQNVPEAFRPGGLNTAGPGYVVGPGDELRLTVWGGAEFRYDLQVDPEGRIYVPKVGQLTVAGKTLEDLREDVRVWLSRSYAGLVDDPPSVFMDLMATRLKPLQVFVLGEVPQPGGYTLPSGSSIFNVLYAVGGPKQSGSLRDVRVVRSDRVASIDLYDYLLKGYSTTDVPLQTGDHVFIPPRQKTVTLRGAVRRPAIYELKQGETFADLVKFAGGLKAEAYTERFHVERIVPFAERQDPAVARTVLDLSLSDVLSGRRQLELEDGDVVTIVSIRDATSLAVRSRVPAAMIEGAVFSPGQFEIGDQVRTVRDLIESADGLTGNAHLENADLVRLNQDLEREIVGLNLSDVLQDDPTQNLVLRPQDSLYVYSVAELEAGRTVSIDGKVRAPGEYPLLDGMTVGDLLFKGGGLRDSVYLRGVFLERADLVRRSDDGRTDEILPFDLEAALQGRGVANLSLRPQDEIVVYEAAVAVRIRQEERFVEVSGAVKNPGRYQYHDGMTLEDLLLRAGGFREDAFLQSAEVTRPVRDRSEGGQSADQIDVPLTSSGELASAGMQSGLLAVADYSNLFAAARSFKLQHRDRVFIREDPVFVEQQSVNVQGEVEFPGEYTLLHENETLSELVRRAGGVLPTGYEKGGRLLRKGNQVVMDMERALQGDPRFDAVLQDGDQVVIPTQPNTVAVRGNVALEGLVKHVPGKRVSYYLDRAGGVLDDTEAIYLTQASGARYRVRRTLFLGGSPTVDDGAGILVTKKPPKEPGDRIDWSRLITDTMAILSSTLTILVLGRRALD